MKLTTLSVRISVLHMLAVLALGCGDVEDADEDFDLDDAATQSASETGSAVFGHVSMGTGYLADGTYVTFTRSSSGKLTAQSPASIKGKELRKNLNGTYYVVN